MNPFPVEWERQWRTFTTAKPNALGRNARTRHMASTEQGPQLDPMRTLDFPVFYHSKIDPADQLGSECLRGFHSSHRLLRGTRVRPENDDAPNDSRNGANHDHRIEPDHPDRHGQD